MVVNGEKNLPLFSGTFLVLANATQAKCLGKSAKTFTPELRNNHLFSRTVAGNSGLLRNYKHSNPNYL